ncbi:hypothetical protein [Halalkalibacillus sediminis]|uniref:hypothetical protein n=1 Tax=Halalkalibacillus sediminis TaxID=2018042 RepID=UPI00192E3A67|nr:hypothetical protein [Halalkalibacillus sediminis]
MNNISRWLIAGVLILFGFLLLNKGLDLWSIGSDVDGEGIGLYFLGIEINDRVPEESIPSYAVGFFISSLVVLILSATIVRTNLKLRNKAS